MKVLIDSSGWIEFFCGGPAANQYDKYIKDKADIITPTIVIYEVYKKIKREMGEENAVNTIAQLGKTTVVPLSNSIALHAADISLHHKLAMADAIVYATSLDEQAELVTSDSELKDLPKVTYIKK